MIASKYLNDEGESEALTNSEWADIGCRPKTVLDEMERQFLSAIVRPDMYIYVYMYINVYMYLRTYTCMIRCTCMFFNKGIIACNLILIVGSEILSGFATLWEFWDLNR